MKKGKFYISSKNYYPFEKGNCYMLIELKKIDENNFYIKIGQIFAILIDRVIFSKTFELITENPENIFQNFKEISLEKAKKITDNTEALLDKNIFRR